MSATINDISHYEDDFEILLQPSRPLDEALSQTKTQALTVEPRFDYTLAGAGAAILVWMALFAGFLYSWFTMGG